MNRILTFPILVSFWGCSAPASRPAPDPVHVAADPIDAGDSVDATDAADAFDAVEAPDVDTWPTCGEILVLEPDGAVTRTEWGPCHT